LYPHPISLRIPPQSVSTGRCGTGTGTGTEAEDLTQEAFLRAWLDLDLLSDPTKFAPWLRRIIFGVSIDWLRAFRPDLYRLSDVKIELELSNQPAQNESALAGLETIGARGDGHEGARGGRSP
jgi:DNA-directed RNA polymerase specialized sigma24 family protein